MTSIAVHPTAQQIVAKPVVKMDSILEHHLFRDAAVMAAAAKFVDVYRNGRNTSLGHTIGLQVHDVRNPTPTLAGAAIHHQAADERARVPVRDSARDEGACVAAIVLRSHEYARPTDRYGTSPSYFPATCTYFSSCVAPISDV